jgi:hypothetical protein
LDRRGRTQTQPLLPAACRQHQHRQQGGRPRDHGHAGQILSSDLAPESHRDSYELADAITDLSLFTPELTLLSRYLGLAMTVRSAAGAADNALDGRDEPSAAVGCRVRRCDHDVIVVVDDPMPELLRISIGTACSVKGGPTIPQK